MEGRTLSLMIYHESTEKIADYLIELGRALKEGRMQNIGNMFDPNNCEVSQEWQKGNCLPKTTRR